ncbi:alpha/beta fold hydrolase [Pendulispora albinea]|uniref:Alpha/beta hydrolase n=1 Tax=Pendulispora albinea TaxID=2741071 RepID=A0ABZ2LVZ3_9BACT
MGSNLPTLSHTFVTAPDHAPSRWIFFLHGILGSGNNFRTLARRWVLAQPSLGLVLVDLRMHGRSQGFEGPHTIESAARDLATLEPTVAERGGSVAGVVGHSFGGKVALQYVAQRAEAGRALDEAWIIDSTPGARPNAAGSESTVRVYNLLRSLPPLFPTRAAFNEALADGGLDIGMIQWLAMNVDKTEGGFRFRLDLDAIGALLQDYFARDFWPVVESPPGTSVHLIIGGRSLVLDEADRERAARAAKNDPRVTVDIIPDAGHWVHVDAPDALFDVLSQPGPATNG